MANPVFKNRQVPIQNQNGSNNQSQQLDFNALYNQFVQNPAKYLSNCNIPPECQTPEQIVRHLAATNQIPPLLQPQIYGMFNKK